MLLPFRFFPKSRPNTDFNVDFFRCGDVTLDFFEGTLATESRTALAVLPVVFLARGGDGGACGGGGGSLSGSEGIVSDSGGSTSSPPTISDCSAAISSSVPVEVLSRICCSSLPSPSEVAIPAPRARIGNSSSSGIGIGGPIRPLIEDRGFGRAGFHPVDVRNLLMVPAEGSRPSASSDVHRGNGMAGRGSSLRGM